MINHIPCVILSGGKSSRMGEDKSLLPFGGYSTLIEYQYNKLSKIFSKVYISSKTNKFDFLQHIEENNKTKLIIDDGDIFSPMVALKSILQNFDDKVFIITVDTPLVTEKIIKELINNSNDAEITIAQCGDTIHNLCGIFRRVLLNKINSYLDNDIHKISFLVRNSNTSYIRFNDNDKFINVNTKDDYQKAQAL